MYGLEMTIIYLLLLLSACNVLFAKLDVCNADVYETTQGRPSVGEWKLKTLTSLLLENKNILLCGSNSVRNPLLALAPWGRPAEAVYLD